METILYPHREYHGIDVDRARFNVPIRVQEITKLRIEILSRTGRRVYTRTKTYSTYVVFTYTPVVYLNTDNYSDTT